jgi:hypothetical protein
MCTICIREGIWDKPIEKECRICGKDRWFSWCSFDYDISKAEDHAHYKVDNPLAEFTDWLLKHWKKPKEAKKKQQKALPKSIQKRLQQPQPGPNAPSVMEVDMADKNEEKEQLEESMDVEDLLGDDQMDIEDEENSRKRKRITQDKPKRKRIAPKKCRYFDMEADVEDADGEDDMEDDETDLDDSFIAPEEELAEEMEADDYRHLNPYLHEGFVPHQMELPKHKNEADSIDGSNFDEEGRSSPISVTEIDDSQQQQPSPAQATENDDIDSECSVALGIRRDTTPSDDYFEKKPSTDKEEWRIRRELLHNDIKVAAIKKKRERDAEKKKMELKNNREVVTYAYSHFGQKYDNVG